MARILVFDSSAVNYSDGSPLPTICKGFSESQDTPKMSSAFRMFSADGEERVVGVEFALDPFAADGAYELNFAMLYYDDTPGLGWPPPAPQGADKWPAVFPRSWHAPNAAQWMRETTEVVSSTDGTVTHYPVQRVLALGDATNPIYKRRFYLPMAVHSRWAAVMHWFTTAPTDETRLYIYAHIGGHAEEGYVEDNPTNGPYRYDVLKPA